MNEQDLGRLFESFVSSAFRLECLEEYAVTEDEERAAFRYFKDGWPLPPFWENERAWLETVRQAKRRGATMQRVRMVYGPLSDYQRFEFAWSYPYNEGAGEQIFVMEHGPTALEPLRNLHDFWLFDDATVVRLIYDDDGKFVGLESVENAELYCRIRDLALANAVPLGQFEPTSIVRPMRGRRTGNLR
jgi:hypothetical protein